MTLRITAGPDESFDPDDVDLWAELLGQVLGQASGIVITSCTIEATDGEGERGDPQGPAALVFSAGMGRVLVSVGPFSTAKNLAFARPPHC